MLYVIDLDRDRDIQMGEYIMTKEERKEERRRLYDFVGDPHEGLIAVKKDDEWFHIYENDNTPAYPERYQKADDFQEGVARVQEIESLLWLHILRDGKPAYNKRFKNVGSSEEGLAQVETDEGWFHVHIFCDAKPVYEKRFKYAEPFRKGQAQVETDEGLLSIYRDASPVRY